MKPLLIALTLLASVFTKPGYANDGKISSKVLHAFESTFTTAQEVDWSVTESLYKAQFTLNGQYVTAYYKNDGDLVALTRNVASQQLPITLQARLKKDYADYWISDLFELSDEEGITYYVTLENADSKVVLKSVSRTKWSTFQKSDKG